MKTSTPSALLLVLLLPFAALGQDATVTCGLWGPYFAQKRQADCPAGTRPNCFCRGQVLFWGHADCNCQSGGPPPPPPPPVYSDAIVRYVNRSSKVLYGFYLAYQPSSFGSVVQCNQLRFLRAVQPGETLEVVLPARHAGWMLLQEGQDACNHRLTRTDSKLASTGVQTAPEIINVN